MWKSKTKQGETLWNRRTNKSQRSQRDSSRTKHAFFTVLYSRESRQLSGQNLWRCQVAAQQLLRTLPSQTNNPVYVVCIFTPFLLLLLLYFFDISSFSRSRIPIPAVSSSNMLTGGGGQETKRTEQQQIGRARRNVYGCRRPRSSI